MNSFKLAFRNTYRNARRSLMTMSALAVGTMAILIFSGYVTDTIQGLQTSTVRSTGHLQIVPEGYLEFGRANPGRFALKDYSTLIDKLRDDKDLKSIIHVVTPVLNIEGVAGNFSTNSSTSFSGQGVVPEERKLQLAWDGFNIGIPPVRVSLSEDRPEAGVIGHGMAQLLGLCKVMKVQNCRILEAQDVNAKDSSGNDVELSSDITTLIEDDLQQSSVSDVPTVDLLASSGGGSPNLARMELIAVQRQAIRELDSMFIAMPLTLAQRLAFGADKKGVSAIIIQLKHTNQMAFAKSRIQEILKSDHTTLEVLTFEQISSVYGQIVRNYDMLFQFIATLIVFITIFSIANAINMSVTERVSEIGTLRALGFQRGKVRSIFLAEGVVLGVLGTILGTIIAIIFGEGFINAGGFSWTPPGRSTPIPINIDMFSNSLLIPFTILGLSLVAVISSVLPSFRAAKMKITEALCHV
jgi:putative ABC transport system permease protein